MRIVVLDAEPANPGDLSWDGLSALGDLHVHDGTGPDDVAARLEGATVAVTNKVRLDGRTLRGADDLRLVCVLATGYDVVDIEAARERGIVVCNVPGYATASTAQLAVALMLELAHRVGRHSDAVHDGVWGRSKTFAWWDSPQVELDGRTMVIVGMGAIGTRVAAVAEALGMHVIAAALPGRPTGGSRFKRVPLDDAIARADVVSLHCPLNDSTRNLVDADRLALFRPGAFLVNTGRGPLVDEHAVAAALRSGALGGYATDVLRREPPPEDDPLVGAPRCIITPHIGWASHSARARLLATVTQNVAAWKDGAPIHVVS